MSHRSKESGGTCLWDPDSVSADLSLGSVPFSVFFYTDLCLLLSQRAVANSANAASYLSSALLPLLKTKMASRSASPLNDKVEPLNTLPSGTRGCTLDFRQCSRACKQPLSMFSAPFQETLLSHPTYKDESHSA